MIRSLVLVALALVGACNRAAPVGGGGIAAGQERGPCKADRSCEVGLTCLSELCVRPPPADCPAVGKQLSFLFLDNYAPREERDAFIAEIGRQCEAMRLSEREADCLTRARDRSELRSCPRLLGVGDCKKIEAHAESLRKQGTVDAYLVTGADRVLARCKTEVPSLAFEQCALRAVKLDDVERCAW